jgi:hypothetical protein
MGVSRVLNCLFREFVSGEMISFSVSGRSSAMSVRRKIVKLSGSIVSALGHILSLLANLMRLRAPLRSEKLRWMFAV